MLATILQMQTMHKKILIFTGEHSGERLGAELIQTIQQKKLPIEKVGLYIPGVSPER